MTRAGSLLVVEAHPGPCTSPGGTVYSQNVRVIRPARDPEFRNLSGCGGRVVNRPDSQ